MSLSTEYRIDLAPGRGPEKYSEFRGRNVRGPLGWKWQVIDPELHAAAQKQRIDRENAGLYVPIYLREPESCILAFGWCRAEDKARKAAEKKAAALHKQRSFLNQPRQSVTFNAEAGK